MKNTNKGFTLVELIVVITILAILGTIAFISLQGYSQDAKNSKVATDLSSLASKINIVTSSKDAVVLNSLVGTDTSGDNGVSGTWAGILITATNYKVGTMDFGKLKENATNFKDPEGKDYLLGTLSEGSTAVFTLAGQTKDAAGNYKAVVKGNFYTVSGDTIGSLVRDKANTYSTWVTNNVNLGTNGLYN